MDALLETTSVLKDKEKRSKILQSVSLGLYEEIDKLAKKAPADQVTDLILEQTNDVIREAKELLSDDVFIQRYKEFVPAGDNPEHRDVVVVLRQIREGLARFAPTVEPRQKWLQTVLRDAKGVRIALVLSDWGSKKITQEVLFENNAEIMNQWLTDDEPPLFDFDRLDQIKIATYYNT